MSSDKIRVLYELRPSIFGGVERFLLDLVGNLDRLRFEPTMITLGDGPVIPAFRSLGIPVQVLDCDVKDRTGKTEKHITDFMRSGDYHIAHSCERIPWFAMAARKVSLCHLWGVHGHTDLFTEESSETKKATMVVLLTLADVIVCPSQFVKSQFSEYRGTDVRVIYNGVDIASVDSAIAELGSFPPPFFSSNPVIATVGYLGPHKRHADFIEGGARVLPHFPESRWEIYGRSLPNESARRYYESLKALSADLGLQQNLSFKKYDAEFVEALKHVDILVCPSLSEAFGYAAWEGMSLSKPVVAVRSGAYEEFIEDQVDGVLVEPGNPESLAEGIMKLLQDPETAVNIGKRGREKIERIFDLKECVAQYERLYEELIQDN